jgi:hypothetical protein
MKIPVRNEVPNKNIFSGTFFLTVLSRGAQGNDIFRKLVAKKRLAVERKASSRYT